MHRDRPPEPPPGAATPWAPASRSPGPPAHRTQTVLLDLFAVAGGDRHRRPLHAPGRHGGAGRRADREATAISAAATTTDHAGGHVVSPCSKPSPFSRVLEAEPAVVGEPDRLLETSDNQVAGAGDLNLLAGRRVLWRRDLLAVVDLADGHDRPPVRRPTDQLDILHRRRHRSGSFGTTGRQARRAPGSARRSCRTRASPPRAPWRPVPSRFRSAAARPASRHRR